MATSSPIGRSLSPESMLILARALQPRRSLVLRKRDRQELESLIPRMWMRDARCGSADPEAWQLGVGQVPSAQSLRVCGDCLARSACLASAILHGECGVWAGTTEHARDQARHLLAAGTPAETVVKELLDDAKPKVAQPSEGDGRQQRRKPCGTVAAYNRGCRCDECGPVGRKAGRERMAAKRKAVA